MTSQIDVKAVLGRASLTILLERIRRGLLHAEALLPKRVNREDMKCIRMSLCALDCDDSVGAGLVIASFALRNICDSGVVEYGTQQEIYTLLERIEIALEHV